MPDDSTATVPLELVERIVGWGGSWGNSATSRMRILSGSLPEDLPIALPLPPDSRLLGSLAMPDTLPDALMGRRKRPVGRSFLIVLDVPSTNVDILAFYHNALAEHGWKPPAFDPTDMYTYMDRGGFRSTPAPSAPSQIFCSGPHGPWLRVTVYDGADGLSDVRIHLSTADNGFCAPQRMGPMGYMAIQRIVPVLQAPSGVTMWGGGGGGSDTQWTTSATAETSMSAADLADSFAAQLVGAGWKRRDGGVNGALAWSSWTLIDDGEWQAMLWVLEEPEPEHRFLRLRVEPVDQAGSGLIAHFSH